MVCGHPASIPPRWQVPFHPKKHSQWAAARPRYIYLALVKAATVLTAIGWAEVQFYAASEKVVEIICKIN